MVELAAVAPDDAIPILAEQSNPSPPECWLLPAQDAEGFIYAVAVSTPNGILCADDGRRFRQRMKCRKWGVRRVELYTDHLGLTHGDRFDDCLDHSGIERPSVAKKFPIVIVNRHKDDVARVMRALQ